jgi:hypothetical protein
MVAEVTDTGSLVATVVVLTIMSALDVPTVRPVTMSVPPVAVRMRPAAAVPDANAVDALGKPLNVRTPPDEVPAGLFSVTENSTVAIPVVPTSSTPVAPIWVTTASSRAFLTAVVYTTVIG